MNLSCDTYHGLVANSFINKDDGTNLFTKFTYRYYIVHYKSSRKRSFESSEQSANLTPETARKLNDSYASFNTLV